MDPALRILIVEDEPDAAALVEDKLREAGVRFLSRLVSSQEDFVRTLKEFEPSLVLSDFTLPHFNGLDILRLTREVAPQVPVVIFTGSIDEETAVECMKAGAADYVLKQHLARLVPAVQGALEKQRARRERERAEGALQQSERRYRDLVQNARDIIFTLSAEGTITSLNPAFERLTGWFPAEWLDKPFVGLLPPEDEASASQNLELVLHGETPPLLELRLRSKNGGYLVGEFTVTPRIHGGDIVGLLGIARDVTERKRAEAALQESEVRFRSAFDNAMIGMAMVTPNGMFVKVNPALCDMLGYAEPEFLRMSFQEITYPEDVDFSLGWLDEFIHGRLQAAQVEKRYRHKEGHVVWAQLSISAVRDPAGQLLYFVNQIQDITERKRAEEALRHTEEKYRSIFENAVEGIFQATPAGRYLSVNPALARMLGYTSPDEVIEHITDIERQLYVEPGRREEFKQVLDDFGIVHGFEAQFYRKDGAKIWVATNARAVRDAQGAILYYEGTNEDISQRLNLENQLRQAQKMESVGQLAAGVAHDFNNILTIITGHTGLLLAQPNVDPAMVESLKQTAHAAGRAANLIRQLLTFSRRQVVQRQVLNLNDIIHRVAQMLQRLLGEHVEMQFQCAQTLPRVFADEGMMEQILINLAVNARDAMPKGGRLLVQTLERKIDEGFVRFNPQSRPGCFVCLVVSDTGCGMDTEIRSHLFEPFFTTKEVGKGTGMGLATVYGIVQSHDGWIEVDSQVAYGSTFRVFLPASQKSTEPAADSRPAALAEPGGRETILVVEDEPVVRGLVTTILKQYGYRILEAGCGVEALAVWQEHKHQIALLLTDMVMPNGISGRELADRLLAENRRLKVIYTSGYSSDVVGEGMALHEGVNFLQKPYPPKALARTVRVCLDGTNPGR